MNKSDKWKQRLVWLLLMISLLVIAVSGYLMWKARQMYAEGDNRYEILASEVRGVPQEPDAAPEQDAPQLDIPDLDINFAALKAVNEDSAAWLYCPDTAIDYPVMKADDYSQYLRHLPDGTYNENGSLFLDYNCAADFTGRLSVIYGHNMNSGKMFAPLIEYKEQEFFEGHPYMYLYTQLCDYRIEILYGCIIGAGEWREQAFMYETNLDSLLEFAASETTFKSGVTYTESDRFLVLSTCSYDFDDARYIVIGVLRQE